MSDWKETVVGLVPEDWDVKTMTEFCLRVADGTHDSPKPQKDGCFLITSRHIVGGKLDLDKAYRITPQEFEQINQRSRVDRWDVLLTMIGTVGEVYLVSEEPSFAIKNIGLFKLGGNEQKARWLYNFFRSKAGQAQIKERTAGTTQEYISLGDLRDLVIPIPNDNELEAINNLLKALEDKIDLLQRQNRTIEALAQTLFRQWFVEEAEEGWEEVRIRDVCKTITKGTTPTTLGNDFTETGINFLKAESITDNGDLIEGKFSHIDQATHEKLGRSKIEANDLIITIAGTIGRVAIIPKRVIPANTNQAVAILRVAANSVSPGFLYCLFKSSEIRNDFESRVVHAVQPNLSLGEIADISFKLPPTKKLEAGERQLELFFQRKERNSVQIRTLIQLRDTLLPKMMSGSVRVAP